MQVHYLKIWPVFFDRVVSGEKTFEIRRNDRDFSAGDMLCLQEWDVEDQKLTGRMAHVVVTYCSDLSRPPTNFDGWCAMQIRQAEEKEIQAGV